MHIIGKSVLSLAVVVASLGLSGVSPAEAGSKLYYVDNNVSTVNHEMYRCNLDGSDNEYWFDYPSFVQDIDMGAVSWVYNVSPSSTLIHRVRLDGTEPTLITALSNAQIAIDYDNTNHKVYTLDAYFAPDNSVRRREPNGQISEVVYTDPFYEWRHIQVDELNSRIYVSGYDLLFDLHVILRMTFNGAAVTEVLISAEEFTGFYVDSANNTIYYTLNSTNSELWRADMDGSNETLLYTSGSGDNLQRVLAFGGKVFVSEQDTESIVRMNTDGSNDEVIVSGVQVRDFIIAEEYLVPSVTFWGALLLAGGMSLMLARRRREQTEY